MIPTYELMEKESWISLIMKMRDMPYYHYKGDKQKGKTKPEKKDKPEPLPGTTDILKTKFAKYIDK